MLVELLQQYSLVAAFLLDILIGIRAVFLIS